jgi:hypothetical protein
MNTGGDECSLSDNAHQAKRARLDGGGLESPTVHSYAQMRRSASRQLLDAQLSLLCQRIVPLACSPTTGQRADAGAAGAAGAEVAAWLGVLDYGSSDGVCIARLPRPRPGLPAVRAKRLLWLALSVQCRQQIRNATKQLDLHAFARTRPPKRLLSVCFLDLYCKACMAV